jgi:hypothetical protein
MSHPDPDQTLDLLATLSMSSRNTFVTSKLSGSHLSCYTTSSFVYKPDYLDHPPYVLLLIPSPMFSRSSFLLHPIRSPKHGWQLNSKPLDPSVPSHPPSPLNPTSSDFSSPPVRLLPVGPVPNTALPSPVKPHSIPKSTYDRSAERPRNPRKRIGSRVLPLMLE